MPDADQPSTRIALQDPEDWVLYLAPVRPKRLVVFVHGFLGGVEKSWRVFPTAAATRPWWKESDLLFVGYDSARDEIAGVAFEIRDRLPDFYPVPRVDLLRPALPADLIADPREYEELVVVAHSLGGVIVRCALLEVARSWLQAQRCEPELEPPRLLDAQLRFFSPASAGFRPGGKLAMLRSSGAWAAIELKLRRSTAYSDLDPGSPVIANTRRRTEALLLREPRLTALSPDIAWARPDNVVLAEGYETDGTSIAVKGKTHREVCKPHGSYEIPWTFVEGGEVNLRQYGQGRLARVLAEGF